MNGKDDQLYFHHIHDAINQIIEYTKGKSLEDFQQDKMLFDAVCLQIETLGEAANHVSEEFTKRHPDLPWRQAVNTRNQIAHGYYQLEPTVIWKTATKDIPELKKSLQEIGL